LRSKLPVAFAAIPCLAALVVAANLSYASTPGNTITLTWTAPGDDSLLGTATEYDLRFDIRPITAQNFNIAFPIYGLPAPAAPRTQQSFTVTNLAGATQYYFALKTRDERGNWSAISNVITRTTSTVDITDGGPVPLNFSTPWPNPATSSTRVSLSLPQAMDASVDVFDVTGRLVRSLARGYQEAGERELAWNLTDNFGNPVHAGVYMMLARLGSRTFVRRVAVTR